MGLRIARVIIHMRDRERQLAFYRDVLGLTVKGDESDPNQVELDGGACPILLVKGGKVGELEYGPRLAFFAEDVAGLHEELGLMGIEVGKLKEFGEHRVFDGIDPEGNPFQITNRP